MLGTLWYELDQSPLMHNGCRDSILEERWKGTVETRSKLDDQHADEFKYIVK